MFIIVGALQAYNFILIVRVFLSWIPLDRSNPTVDQIVQLLYDITEPVLAPVRNALPPTAGFDFSPLIVLVGINVIIRLLTSL